MICVVAIVAMFGDTATAAVSLWIHSSAYNYAVLVLPVSLYLIWERRRELACTIPEPTLWGLVLLPLLGAVWLLAHSADIAEAEQFALMGMIQVALFTILGRRVYRVLLLPFAYLFLMVPSGEFLLDPLQRTATVVTSTALRLSEVPVFSEGTFVETPTGVFEIAPGCAGLNFLLTALALSLVFADLTFRSLRKRILCVAIALAAAIVVNWIRIYAILLIDYLSGHRSSIVDDHLIYGWGGFAILMVPMIWLGLGFRDPPSDLDAGSVAPQTTLSRPGNWSFAIAAAAAALLAVIAPAYAAFQESLTVRLARTFEFPPVIGDWQRVAESSSVPAVPAPSSDWGATYRSDLGDVMLTLADYTGGREPRELSIRTGVQAKDGALSLQEGLPRRARINGSPVEVMESCLFSAERRWTIWHLYWVAGGFMPDWPATTWRHAIARLLGELTPDAIIIPSAEEASGSTTADAALQVSLDQIQLNAILRVGLFTGIAG